MRLPLVLALLALLAGCVTPPASDIAPASLDAAGPLALDAARALLAGVPCEATVDAGTSANLAKLGDLRFDTASSEMDVRGHMALVGRESPPGLYVVDLTDPTVPRQVSALDLDSMPLDVKWTATGDGALVGTFGKLTLIDLADPVAPIVRGEVVLPTTGAPRNTPQAHSFSTGLIDGQEWIYVSGQTAPYGTFAVQREGWDLTVKGQYRTAGLLSTPIGHHDATLVVDPLMGNKTFLYVAQGFEGWSVADLSDPANPKELGRSLPELGPGYTHMVRGAFVGDKRILISMQEVGVNTLSVYDATDLASPKLIARWSADKMRPQLPQHNIQVAGDYLYMAHYELGFFVFNLTATVEGSGMLPALTMPVVAHYTPEHPTPSSEAYNTALGFTDVIDIQVLDGVLVVNDMEDGLSTMGFGCIKIGDPTQNALK